MNKSERETVEAYYARKREQNRVGWIEFYRQLEAAHLAISNGYAAKAAALSGAPIFSAENREER